MNFNLLDELKQFKPYNEQELQNVNKVKEFLTNNTNCYDRSNKFGHITCGAFVCDKSGNILLNHHKKSGMWFQFGGHSENETDCLAVAKREVKEETGIENYIVYNNSIYDVDVQLIEYNEGKNEPEHLHFDINFMFIVDNHNFKVSNESKEIKWVTINEARKLVHPLDTGIRRMIDKYEDIIINKKI